MGLELFFDNFTSLVQAPNGITKLRELVLTLAVQGKLGTQNETDESAESLFTKTQRHRAQLIKDKRIKISKSLPAITKSELPFDIPSNWRWIRLGEIGDWGAGATPDRKNSRYYGGKYRWFKSGELNNDYLTESEETVSDLALKECSLRLNQPGDVLIAMYGATIGKLAIPGTQATTNQAVCACTCYDGFFNRFLFVLLRAYKNHFTERGAGGAQPNISREKIIHTVAPLPPFDEQKRIVAKVDELMRLCDDSEAKQHADRKSRVRLNNAALAPLNKVASLRSDQFEQATAQLTQHFDMLYESVETVGKLRLTVLRLAVQGRLLAQDPNDEHAELLMERVDQEKKKLIREGILANKRPLTEIADHEKEIELPNSWCWVRLGWIADQRLGKMLDKSKNKGALYPYLRNSNVQWLRFDLSDIKDMKFEDDELEEYKIKVGDLLICEGGEPGRCAIWQGEIEHIMFQKAIHRVRPFCEINSWFVLYRLLCDAMTGSLDRHFTGATIKHLTGQELSKYVIGLPPLEEQRRIVAKITQLMALCDDLEAKLRQAEAHSEKLMNAAVQHVLDVVAGKNESQRELALALSSTENVTAPLCRKS